MGAYTNIDIILSGIVVLLGLTLVVLAVRMRRLDRRLGAFLTGKDAKSLEDVFVLLRREVMDTRRSLQALDGRIAEAREKLRGSVQNVGIVRFNPFRDAGGDQSFCIALLDEAHNGVVISSLYARDGVRIYGKPVQAGASAYQLSKEEMEAIQRAIQVS